MIHFPRRQRLRGVLVGLALLPGLALAQASVSQVNGSYIFGKEWAMPVNLAHWGIEQADAKLNADAKKIKILVVVRTRGESIESGSEFRQNRYYINQSELDFLNSELKRFENWFENLNQGNADLQFVVQADSSPVLQYPGEDFSKLVDRRSRVAFNEATFESDDQTFRGPYSGVWILSPIPGQKSVTSGALRFGTPTSQFSFIQNPESVVPGALSSGFAAALAGNLDQRSASGFVGLGSPYAEFWKTISDAGEDLRFTGEPVSGAKPPSPYQFNYFPLYTEGEGQVWLNAFWMSQMRVKPAPTGMRSSEQGPVYGFSPSVVASMQSAATPVTLPAPNDLPTGGFKSRSVEGDVLKISVDSNTRWGACPIGNFADRSGGNNGKTTIKFELNTDLQDLLELRTLDSNGKILARRTFGTGTGLGLQLEPLQAPSWQPIRLVLDLSGAEVLELGFAPEAMASEPRSLGPRSIAIRSLEFNAGVPASADNDQFSPDSISGINELPTDALVTMLTGSAPKKTLAALVSLSNREVPATAFARLKELSRNADPATAFYAIKCISKSESPEAVAQLQYNLQVGPFDHCRFAAAYFVTPKANSAYIGSLATFMTCSSALARQAAIEALAKIGSKESQIIAITMLPDPDPSVRLAVAEHADTSLELINRRLLFSAVNDPVEEVRLACYLKLIRSTISDYVTEGIKGVRDESPYVRFGIVRSVTQNPAPVLRTIALLGVIDSDARVRAEALYALAALPGNVKKDELGRIASDSDPRVQAAFAALKKAKVIE